MLPWVLALCVLAQGPAPGTPEQLVDRARSCLHELDFSCAEQAFAAARRDQRSLSPARARELLSVGAEAALALQHEGDAEERLLELLVLEPSFRPPPGAWPPSWQAVFARAKARVPDRDPPVIERFTIDPALLGGPVVVRALLSDPAGVARSELRVGEAGQVFAMTSTDGRSWVGIVPAEHVPPEGVWVDVWAYDAYGNGPSHGEAQLVAPEASASRPPSTWWFWTAIGAVVLGAIAVAAGAAAHDDSGRITARIEWPIR